VAGRLASNNNSSQRMKYNKITNQYGFCFKFKQSLFLLACFLQVASCLLAWEHFILVFLRLAQREVLRYDQIKRN